jgi:hypothetical protein
MSAIVSVLIAITLVVGFGITLLVWFFGYMDNKMHGRWDD